MTVAGFIFGGIAVGRSVAGVVVEGECEYVVHPDNREPSYLARYSFQVSVQDDTWIVNYATINIPGVDQPLVVRGTASCDGANVHRVDFLSVDAVKKAWGDRYESVKHELPDAQAVIYPGTFPPADPIVMQQLWLAFASGRMFASTSGTTKPPMFTDLAIFYESDFRCAYRWSTNGIESRIQFRSLGILPVRDPNTGELGELKTPAYTIGEGVWRGSLTIDGQNVATRFDYAGFAPPGAVGGVVGQPLRSWIFHATVTNVGAIPAHQVPSQLPSGRVLITDRRFIPSGHAKVDYISTNGWLAADDPHVKTQLLGRTPFSLEQEFARAYAADGSATLSRTGWVTMAVCATMIVPPFIWFTKCLCVKKKNGPTNNKNK